MEKRRIIKCVSIVRLWKEINKGPGEQDKKCSDGQEKNEISLCLFYLKHDFLQSCQMIKSLVVFTRRMTFYLLFRNKLFLFNTNTWGFLLLVTVSKVLKLWQSLGCARNAFFRHHIKQSINLLILLFSPVSLSLQDMKATNSQVI